MAVVECNPYVVEIILPKENEQYVVTANNYTLLKLEEYKQKNIDIFDIKVNRGTLEQHFINLSRGV